MKKAIKIFEKALKLINKELDEPEKYHIRTIV